MIGIYRHLVHPPEVLGDGPTETVRPSDFLLMNLRTLWHLYPKIDEMVTATPIPILVSPTFLWHLYASMSPHCPSQFVRLSPELIFCGVSMFATYLLSFKDPSIFFGQEVWWSSQLFGKSPPLEDTVIVSPNPAIYEGNSRRIYKQPYRSTNDVILKGKGASPTASGTVRGTHKGL
jgi:hypothetical protein